MSNIATLLKNEIARIARKEVRAELESLRKAVTSHRSSIAELKRSNQALEQELRRVRKSGGTRGSAAPAAESAEEPKSRLRFSAKGLATQRQRLGLSAHDYGLLLGVSGQSIYKWEDGAAIPRARHLTDIAALRTIGKKEARARLEQLKQTQ